VERFRFFFCVSVFRCSERFDTHQNSHEFPETFAANGDD